MKHLTVLFDPDCPLCVRCWKWVQKQALYVPVRFLPQGSAAAAARFPALNVGVGQPVDDLIAVDDAGNVYRNDRAWILCLWAMKKYRPLSVRLSRPALQSLARRAYHVVSRNRNRISRCLGDDAVATRIAAAKLTDAELDGDLRGMPDPACHPRTGHGVCDALAQMKERPVH